MHFAKTEIWISMDISITFVDSISEKMWSSEKVNTQNALNVVDTPDNGLKNEIFEGIIEVLYCFKREVVCDCVV